MGFYSRVLFPRLCEHVMDRPPLTEQRASLLAEVEGQVLEIGVGTGLNLPHYPRRVERISTVDPNPGMDRRLARRMTATGRDVDRRVLGGEELPFEDASFDYVVSTWTLCSIPEVDRALGEMYRVLRPGGRFLFLEHGLSPDEHVCKWQRRLNGFQKLIADGCRLDLDVRAVLTQQPFSSTEIEEFYLDETPRTQGYMYRGTAIK